MKKKIADKWIKALRSGKYKQGTGVLKDSMGNYCCLGVLCDLAVKEGICKENGNSFISVNGTDQGTHTLFPSVMKWSGIKRSCGQVENESLVHLNDKEGYTFEDIANVIEDYYKDL